MDIFSVSVDKIIKVNPLRFETHVYIGIRASGNMYGRTWTIDKTEDPFHFVDHTLKEIYISCTIDFWVDNELNESSHPKSWDDINVFLEDIQVIREDDLI